MDKILFGGFNGITETDAVEDDVRALADAGIDIIYMTWLRDEGSRSAEQLEWLEKYGVKSWINDYILNSELEKGISPSTARKMASEYMASPAFAGNYLLDEPSCDRFPALKKICGAYHDIFPDKSMYVNLLPNYAPASCYPDGSFREYVAEYCRQFDTPMVSQDSYPINIENGAKVINRDYFEGLNVTAEAARDYGRRHELYIYSTCDNINDCKRYLPSISDLRFEAYSSLAYGAKTLSYFCFDTPPCAKRSPSYAMRKLGHATELYYRGKELTREIGLLSEIYVKYRWIKACSVKANGSSGAALPEEAIRDGYIEEIASNGDLLVGVFESADAQKASRAYMIVNVCDINKPAQADISIKPAESVGLGIYGGGERPVTIYSGGRANTVIPAFTGLFVTAEK